MSPCGNLPSGLGKGRGIIKGTFPWRGTRPGQLSLGEEEPEQSSEWERVHVSASRHVISSFLPRLALFQFYRLLQNFSTYFFFFNAFLFAAFFKVFVNVFVILIFLSNFSIFLSHFSFSKILSHFSKFLWFRSSLFVIKQNNFNRMETEQKIQVFRSLVFGRLVSWLQGV